MRKYFILLVSFYTILSNSESFAVSEVFIQRHSGKVYDASRAVSKEQIDAMIQAARWAPSSHNDQPWNFIFCEHSTTPEAYNKALSCLKEKSRNWAKNAPLLILIVARTQLSHKYQGKLNKWAQYDTGAAAISMALQATDLGLMAHQIGGFDKEKAKLEFQLPENCIPMAMMVVGYEGAETNLPPKLRVRDPIEKNFFLGKWGCGISNP